MDSKWQIKRVAFVSTRIAGSDGVSLEIAKWARIIEKMGMECYYICGESDRPPERSAIIEEAHFNHPSIRSISDRAFDTEIRTSNLTDDILTTSRIIRYKLNAALEQFDIDAIIAENALTIPMNVPLGIALVQSVLEEGIGCLAHHHDFYWERVRFLTTGIDDLIHYAFPPILPQIQHVVINSLAAQEFSRRTGLSCRIIPNVMDFEVPPNPPDDYARQFRKEIGLASRDILILQPTRVVARKGIEHSIELARRIDARRTKLVITYAGDDEGDAYSKYIQEFAEYMAVDLIFVEDRIAEKRGLNEQGRKLFTIEDAYSQADLIAYPSDYEGFGNAFLEAVYYKKPVVCNRYSIFRTDIEPCGFRPILFDGFLTGNTVEEVRSVLDDDSYRQDMVEHNFQIGAKFFGFDVVEQELQSMLVRPQNIYRLLGRVTRGLSPALSVKRRKRN